MACCGGCVPGPAGATYPNATASTRPCKYKTVHKRFSRWAAGGVWERVFRTLTKDANNEYLMIDSTIVRAHQQAATERKKGPDQALGRSRGGLTTTIHL